MASADPTPASILSDVPDISSAMPLSDVVGRSFQLDAAPAVAAGINIDQYLGPWAIEPFRGMQILGAFQSLNLAAHIQAVSAQPTAARGRQSAAKTGRMQIGVVEVEGALTKRGSSLGSGADSLLMVGRAVTAMASSSDIDAIVMVIDSPGGTVAGTQEVAQRIAKARQAKPVIAWVRDLTASAAYWLASQCDAIYCNVATAMVGSIGTYIGLYDLSKWADMQGIEALVIRARDEKEGNVKGTGFPGAKVTDQQRAYLQNIVERCQDEFSGGVASGRGLKLSRVEELAIGAVWQANDPDGSDLTDGIAEWDEVLEKAAQMASAPAGERRKAVSIDNDRRGLRIQSGSGGLAALLEGFKTKTFALPASADTPAATDTPEAPPEASATDGGPANESKTPQTAPDGSGGRADGGNAAESTGEGSPGSAASQTPTPEPNPGPSSDAADPTPTPSNQETTPMSNQTNTAPTAVAATLAELKAAFPKATSDFVVGQLEAGATLDAARNAHSEWLQSQLDAANTTITDLKSGSTKSPGNDEPLGDGGGVSLSDCDDAEAEWKTAISAKVSGGMKKPDATRAVAAENPELRKRYVAAVNLRMGRKTQAMGVLDTI